MDTYLQNIVNRFSKKQHNIGIVLSGGGARGFTHLGVIQALQEKGIYPDIISGVSAGAIAGAFIASGITPISTMKLMLDYKLFDFASLHIPRSGLLSLDNLEKNILSQLPHDSFEELNIPLYAAVSNINLGKVEYINSGSLSKVIGASASIPVLFSSVKINGFQYVDGGLFDNMPIAPLLGKCKKIIGVSISPVQEINKLDNLIQIAGRTFQLIVNSNVISSVRKLDLFIEPTELCDFDIMDISSAQKLFDLGYNFTKKTDIRL